VDPAGGPATDVGADAVVDGATDAVVDGVVDAVADVGAEVAADVAAETGGSGESTQAPSHSVVTAVTPVTSRARRVRGLVRTRRA